MTDAQLDAFISAARAGRPPVGNHWKIDTAHGMTHDDIRHLLRDFITQYGTPPFADRNLHDMQGTAA